MARWASAEALVYPIANTAHVIGAIMLVGAIGLLDLRILGFARAVPADAASRALTPLALAGFAIMAASGATMFAADARAMAGSPLFVAKLALIGLAGLNALAFRLNWRRLDEAPPLPARVLAGASLLTWLGIVILGRLIAYF